jgi:hypothetical protein
VLIANRAGGSGRQINVLSPHEPKPHVFAENRGFDSSSFNKAPINHTLEPASPALRFAKLFCLDLVHHMGERPITQK